MEMTTQEREFLQALLSSKSVNQARKKVGFSTLKAYNLWNDKEFRAEFNKANDEIIMLMVTQLSTLSMNALEVLAEVMNNPSEKGAVKVQASKTILDTLLKLRDQQSLSNRMDEIEERLEQLNEGGY